MYAWESEAVMNQPLFSIITVCLNDRVGLERTCRSINGQICTDFEWIVIDGESGDGTVEFLRDLDASVHWISEPDDGLYDAMNKGVEKATGKYLLFLNAGDELAAPDVLEKTAEAMKARNWPDLLYGNTYERTADGQLLHKQSGPHERIWYGMFTHHQSIFYKRSTVGVLRYRLEYSIASDYAFTGEVLAISTNIIHLPFEVSIFEQGGLSFQGFSQSKEDYWRIKRDVLHHSLVSRVFTRCAYNGMHFVRLYMPAIYRWLRFS